jgi:hypothetical protein
LYTTIRARSHQICAVSAPPAFAYRTHKYFTREISLKCSASAGKYSRNGPGSLTNDRFSEAQSDAPGYLGFILFGSFDSG